MSINFQFFILFFFFIFNFHENMINYLIYRSDTLSAMMLWYVMRLLSFFCSVCSFLNYSALNITTNIIITTLCVHLYWNIIQVKSWRLISVDKWEEISLQRINVTINYDDHFEIWSIKIFANVIWKLSINHPSIWCYKVFAFSNSNCLQKLIGFGTL